MFLIVTLIEGASEKVTQWILILKSAHTKNFCFKEWKCIFKTAEKATQLTLLSVLYEY